MEEKESEHKKEHSTKAHHEHSSHPPVHHHKKDTKTSPDFLVALAIILGIILFFNFITINQLSSTVSERITDSEEFAKPAKLQLIEITFPGCTDCFSVTALIESIKKANVEIVKEDSLRYDSAKGKELIEKYEIDKIPTLIVAGELNKTDFRGFLEREDALIFMEQSYPYGDTDGTIIGRVIVTHVFDKSCTDCTDLTSTITQLKSIAAIGDVVTYDRNSADGKALISKYQLERVPILIFSKDLEVYNEIVGTWSQVGTVEKDGSYVMRNVEPPFIELPSGKKRGTVDITYLVDNACEECYDVSLHKDILTNPRGLNVKIGGEKTIAISSAEGKALLAKYAITKVPTVILSEDAGFYTGVKQVWSDVGTFEDDGVLVFRQLEVLRQPFKDLESGEVVGSSTS